MELAWVNRQFPNASGKHEKTSEPDEEYNCVAFAAHDQSTWWSHESGYKWPAFRSPSISSLVAVFKGLGFEGCGANAEFEKGYEKVALYALSGNWTHAARQLPSGRWKSKLGPDEDIEHDAPDVLYGDGYGDVHCIMRRKL